MAQPRARLGDKSDHGGVIVTAAATVMIDGIPVARLGDIHECPKHGPSPIVTASTTVMAEGRPVARLGDKVACGATIIQGSPEVSSG